jgi:hypothetical protein
MQNTLINYTYTTMKNIFYIILACAAITWFGACSKDNNSVGKTTAGTAGSLTQFVIVSDYLYTISDTSLLVFDVANAQNPILKKTVPIEPGIEALYPFQNKLFIASNSGMHVYNITNPTNPIREAAVQHLRGCDPVVANASNAYLTIHNGSVCRGAGINELQVYNTTNSIVAPQFIKSIPMASPIGLGISGNHLLVCNKTLGLAIFDITNGNNPVLKTSITGENFIDIIIYGSTAVCMLQDGIAYYDISDMNNVTKLSSIKN